MTMRTEANRTRPAARIAGAIALGVLIALLTAAAKVRLRGSQYPLDLQRAWEGARETLGATGPAAIKSWLVLAVVLVAVGGWLRRRAPSLRPSEAALGAVVLLWSGAYVTILALGPLGLYRSWVLRALLLAVVALALRRRRVLPASPPPPAPLGAHVALGAFALAAGPLLLMQLGSPVSPFMDVLPYVASTQKIVTFQLYEPFANDAAGHWSPTRQVVGCDALFSFLALVTGQRAELAITSLIVPAAAFQLTGLYLLGRAVHGSLAGGMATLFVLQVFVWRRTPDIRGTALAFALIATGLAFLFDRRRDRGTRTLLAGLAFGTAVVVNPLIGPVGMQVAALNTLVAWLDGAWPLLPPVLALAGATVMALPQVSVGMATYLPVWMLPVVVAGGYLVLLVAARVARGARPAAWRRCGAARIVALCVAVGLVISLHAQRRTEHFPDDWIGYGPVVLLAVPGIAVLGSAVLHAPARLAAAAIPAVAIAVGIGDHFVADPLRFQGTLEGRSLASEVTTKMMYYWWPYWLALLTGVAFARVPRRRAVTPALALALVIVLYPFDNPEHTVEFDTKHLSLAETWGHHLAHAAQGYHGGRPDRRWVLDQDWQELRGFFLDEIAAGRVDYHTHVLQVSNAVYSLELALGTGVSVDLVTPQYDPGSIWTVGGRIRGLDALPERMAARPPYVLVTQFDPNAVPGLAGGYDRAFERPRQNLALYRRRDLAP